MNKKAAGGIASGVTVAIILILVVPTFFSGVTIIPIEEPAPPREFFELSFSYDDANSKIGNALAENDIHMSSVLKFSDKKSIENACPLIFSDKESQKIIEYCTSADIIDSEGNHLGNIHIVGTPTAPKFVTALIQVNPFMNELDSVKDVFRSSIESLVDESWVDIQPGGYETIDDWIDAHREYHLQATRTTSNSKVNLPQNNLEIEITTNPEGYLWKLFITK